MRKTVIPIYFKPEENNILKSLGISDNEEPSIKDCDVRNMYFYSLPTAIAPMVEKDKVKDIYYSIIYINGDFFTSPCNVSELEEAFNKLLTP